MANVSANINTTSISVTNTPSNITVTDTDSGSNVNVTISNTNLTVGTTTTNVLVSAGSILSNAVIRNAISVTDTGGDGSLSYNSTSGIITYTGPSQAEVLAHFSNVSPINLEANGQISVDESAIFSGKTTDDLTEGSTNLYFKQSANNTTSGTITAGAFVGDGSGLTGGVSFLTNAQVITHISTIPLTVGGNLTVNGNLEVSGNLNYRNVEDLYVRDQKITLNANALSNSNVEIISNRPTATDAIIRWNEQDDKWQFTNDGTTYIDLGGATEVVVDNGNISGNVSLNVDSGTIHKGLLVGNITGLNFTNIASGQTITTILTQDSVGTRLLDTTTTPSNWTAWEFVGDNKTLSTNPDAIDILVTVYDGSKYYASLVSIDGRLIENASLANSNITVNGTTIDLGSSGNIATISNAQAQAYIQENGLTMTNTITSNSLISTTGNLQVNADTLIDGLLGLTFDSGNNYLGIGTTTPEYAIHVVADDQVEAEIGISEHDNSSSGPNIRFRKSKGNVAVPTIIDGHGDRLGEINWQGYDGAAYITPVNFRAATDDAYASVTANNIPWVVEVAGYKEGDVANNSFRSFMKIRSNGAFELGEMSTDDATGSNITLEGFSGNIRTIGGITASGTISGATLTDNTLSINAGAITNATSGTFSGQVQAGSFTDGTINITGGNISTAQNIGATGTIDTNGLIKTFGGNIEAAAGNIVGVYLHGDGSNISGISGSGTVTSVTAGAGLTQSGNANIDPTIDVVGGFGITVNADSIELTNADLASLSSNVITTANMAANYFIATEEFIGDIEGAISEKGYNNTGSTLTKGDAVYVNGYQGDTPNIALANAESAAHMPAVGIVKANISAGDTGQFVVSGVMNFTGHGFTAGDELFVNGAGTLVTTAPTSEANLIQKIGKALGPNHILVQGAGRTNATPNLNENNIFVGNAANRVTTVSLTGLTQNLKTTGNLQVNPDTAVGGLKGLTFDASTNRLGLGTTTPEYGLHMVSDGDIDSQLFMDEYSTSASANDIRMRRAEGTSSAPRFVNSGDHIGQWYHYGWRENADPTGNAAFSDTYGGSFATTGGVEISSFADGDYLVHHLPVGNLTAQGGSLGDRLKLTDQTIRFNDGTIFVLDGTTNANLTSLNGQAFYVDQGGGSTSRTYDLYYDEARTNPVQVATGTEDFTDGQANVVSVAQPMGIEFIVNDGSSPGRFSTRRITKLRANGEMQFGCSDTDKDGTPTATIDVDGVIESTGNITTTANVSGNYILGNGSQLTGIAGSYGNSDVATFLDSDTMTANIEFTGNLLVGAPAANVIKAVSDVQAFDNGSLTEDSITFSDGQSLPDGTAVTYSGATNVNVTPLNTRVFYLKFNSGDGGRYELFDDAGFSTGSRRVTGGGFYGTGVGNVEYAGVGSSQANIEGPVYANANVESQQDIVAANASFADKLYPYTGGGTIGFTSPRMSDVGLGGSGGTDFFWPETGRPDAGSLLIAGNAGAGYWAPGVHIQNDALNDFQPANIISATATSDGVTNLYKRARGNISAPASLENVVSGNDRDRIARTEYFGHDGTNYLNSFNCSIYADANISAGGVANITSNVMPLSMEFSTWENGELAKNNLGYGFPIMKLRADRTIEFNSPNPQTFNNPQGNANITADGSINSNANITSVANINAAGATFTGPITSNSLIRTTGNVQINPDTEVSGLKGFTFDTSNNFLGIGTTTPSLLLDGTTEEHSALHIKCDDQFHGTITLEESRNSNAGPEINFMKAWDLSGTPSAVGNGNRIQEITSWGYDGTTMLERATFRSYVDYPQQSGFTVDTGNVPVGWEFITSEVGNTAPSATSSVLKVRANGTIQVGQMDATSSNVGTKFQIQTTGDTQLFEGNLTLTQGSVTLGERLKLKNYTTTEINALASPAAGDTVFNTTESTICFYNGSAWHKVTSTAL